ncbi:MAG TPA: carbon-nitrogen hydrolase [Opitutales bacterium]|nr:carbon-nitrogen hydrolase [Opitutales bacterium]
MQIALLQLRDYGSLAANRAQTIKKIAAAARHGADIVCTQELFTTPYFCITQDPAQFDLAETIPGPTTDLLCAAAKKNKIVVIASLFENRGSEVYHNTAVVIDADGTLLGKYRKNHIPQDPAFEEKFYFTPGDLGYRAWKTKAGRIGVLICWDQWYPEAARLTALKGADIIFYPTAIGWLPSEKKQLGAAQHTAWETVQRGHAVANGCYIAAVNRVGREGGTEFWGQSFVADPYGRVVARASVDKEEILYADVDVKMQSEFRRIWPFFRDRRIDTYGDLTKRLSDEK